MRAPVLTAALALSLAAVALGGCGGSESFPSDPEQLVAADAQSADLAIALGLRPVASFGGDPGWADTLRAELPPDLAQLEVPPATGLAVNALAGRDPDAIVAGPAWRAHGFDDDLEGIAPTAWLEPVAGTASPWKAPLLALGDELGREDDAAAVAAAVDNRAAALRPQVKGKTVAVIRIAAPTSFSADGESVPTSRVLAQDLGLTTFRFRDQQYPYGCAPSTHPAKPCRTNNLYSGLTGFMGPVDALLVETGWASVAAAKAFTRDAHYRVMPAVRAGRVAEAASFTELGPIGVGHLYANVAKAFGLDELHAPLGAAALNATLDRTSRKLCWALQTGDPSSVGERLSIRGGDGEVELAPAPAFVDDGSGVSRATGCAALTAKVGGALVAGTASVALGGASSPIQAGAASIVQEP